LILTNDLTLEAVLGGAVSANQPEFHVDYFVRDNNAPQQNIAWQPPKPSTLRGALNSTTDVTLISPTTGRYSTQGFVAEVTGASIYNKDTASVAVTVKTTDGSTDRIICKATLATTETLIYTKEGQWYVMTADGAFKNDSITYAESTWTPTLTFATPGDLSVSYAARVGQVTKIGRKVFANLYLVTSAFTHTTASGSCNITGLPYTSANSGQFHMGTLAYQGITKANYTHGGFLLGANATLMTISLSGSGQARSDAATGDMPTGGTVVLIGEISYHV
jgi:hypothetical protein